MDRERLFEHKLRNNLQTLGLVGLLAGLAAYLAWFVGGETFVWAALFGVLALYLLHPAGSPRWVLSMYRARPIRPEDAPVLHAVLGELARRAELPYVPPLYYLPSRVMNAFATGQRDEALIAVSDGLLRRLDRREIAGVLAHELSHIVNGDIRVMALADLVSRITSVLSFTGQLLLVLAIPLMLMGVEGPPWIPILILIAAPTLSALIQLALSRNREFEADRSAAELTGDPEGLASALLKLERYQGPLWEQLVMPGRRVPDPSLLRTHPPTEERVRRLMELTPRRGYAAFPDSLMLGELDPLAGFGRLHRARPRWHVSGLWY
ncbi:zinc metalloprotease HtpX [Imhoffiella purpurea]|uniref:Peptidase, M48 family n=1 Tax=Imhoffiella purpurea TaxID=1249627 RepID=W9V2C8_9GAMM|nr:zinc metalloprotease HtpX [Imhoffiella purpurea]EXJ13653.1 Peptidase, M48 family [Imhoffiella purpurea]